MWSRHLLILGFLRRVVHVVVPSFQPCSSKLWMKPNFINDGSEVWGDAAKSGFRKEATHNYGAVKVLPVNFKVAVRQSLYSF